MWLLLFTQIGAAILVLIVSQAFLYSGRTTHPYLTEQIIKLYNHYYDPDITPEQMEWVKRGSSNEYA